jgi:hypothetical protein
MTENDYSNFVKELEEKYPKMFEHKYGGIATGPGWWPLVESLCQLIQQHCDHNECPQVVIEQVKEKFGGLRFYYQGGDEFIHGAVWLAESMSVQMCEECGAPGTRGGSGWVTTLCETHRTAREVDHRKYMKDNGLEE